MKSSKASGGTAADRIVAIVHEHGELLRTSQALRSGIHPKTLYTMRDTGILEQVSRGLFRLAGSPPLGDPDLVIVATKVPQGVICLISALAFHELTNQIPHAVHLALPKGAEEPRVAYPPIRTYRFATEAYRQGVEIHSLDRVKIRVYSPEKTLADCFKFRNRIGLDTALEALRAYRQKAHANPGEILRFAKVCRVEKVIRPYLEALFP